MVGANRIRAVDSSILGRLSLFDVDSHDDSRLDHAPRKRLNYTIGTPNEPAAADCNMGGKIKEDDGQSVKGHAAVWLPIPLQSYLPPAIIQESS